MRKIELVTGSLKWFILGLEFSFGLWPKWVIVMTWLDLC